MYWAPSRVKRQRKVGTLGGGTIADLAHDDTVDAVLILIFIAASSIFRSLNSCSSVNVSICLVLILFWVWALVLVVSVLISERVLMRVRVSVDN